MWKFEKRFLRTGKYTFSSNFEMRIIVLMFLTLQNLKLSLIDNVKIGKRLLRAGEYTLSLILEVRTRSSVVFET